MRIVGAIAILVIAVLSIFFVFYQQREKKNTAMKLRLFYSDMTQTMQYSMNINGSTSEWGWHAGYKNADVINNNLANYLRVSQNCVKEKGDCFSDLPYKNLDERLTKVTLHGLPSIRLQNGIAIAFETVSDCKKKNQPCTLVYADINGSEAPNTFGKDLFVFMILNSESVVFAPYNAMLSSKELVSDKKYGCNVNSEIPMYCSAVIYNDGWTINSKYPW